MDENPYAPPTTIESAATPAAVIDPRYRGIGGWLILVGLGLVVTPFVIIRNVKDIYLPISTSGQFSELTDPASPSYDALLVVLLPLGLLTDLITAAAAIVGLVLMVRKSRIFPKWMIGYYLFNVVVIVTERALAQMTPNAAEYITYEMGYILGANVHAAIWIPYMLVSKRVKATFVE